MNDDATTHPAVALLADLVRFPSLSHEEGPIADFLASYVSERGLEVHRHGDNLHFALGEGGNRLLLNSHLDVVPASAGHPFDPFEPTVSGGFLYGRGSVDAKASVASMVTAVLTLAGERWQQPEGQVLVALTTCEETGGDYNGLEDLLPQLPEFSAALVGEPTSLRPCTAQKGLLILTLRASGRSAHAARATLGENAIMSAAADILRISELRFDRVDPLLGPITVTPTLIAGGKAKNIVPDECTFTLDVRSTPAYTHDELVEIIGSRLQSEVVVHSDRLVPVATAPEEGIVRAAVLATGAPPFGSPTMSDWIFLAGTPTVKIGPGDSQLSHTAEERVSVEEVVRAADMYKNIITRYFSTDTGG